jgi:acetylornithine/N-succinyldiaminopimelate aminotransferase
MVEHSKEKLVATQFRNDPRVRQAKNLLMEAIQDHQTAIKGIRPAQVDLIQSYEELIAEFSSMRGGKLYYPYIGSGFGKGPLVELLDGSVKYDMISGIGVHYWGHSHPQILNESFDAILNDTVMQGHLQQNLEAVTFSKLIIDASGLDHCFLTTSGAMANENALKIIFQKKFPAHRILAFEKCFMGRSLTLSQITDKPAYREGIPLNTFVDYVPFYDATRPEESTQEAVIALKNHIKRYPKEHAAFCFELVQGEGGFHPGTTDFFKALMSVAKEHNIAIFIDEVQTFGRTTKLFAFQHFELETYAEVVTIGKLSQVCATLFKEEFKPKPGLLSQTFTGSTTALQVGHFIIRELIQGNYFGKDGKIASIHDRFEKHLTRLHHQYPEYIQGPYGIGAMIAFTLFNGDFKLVSQFVQDLFQAGVISFIAGNNPTRVRFLAPVGAMTVEAIDEVMKIVEMVLTASQESKE